MNGEGLADVEAANPFRLPRLHPGTGSASRLFMVWLGGWLARHGLSGGGCVHGDTSTADIRQVPGETGGVGRTLTPARSSSWKTFWPTRRARARRIRTNRSTTWSP